MLLSHSRHIAVSDDEECLRASMRHGSQSSSTREYDKRPRSTSIATHCLEPPKDKLAYQAIDTIRLSTCSWRWRWR